MSRYSVMENSATGHCFEATVVDTQNPDIDEGFEFTVVCECFDLDDANKIADLLNKTGEQ